MQIKVECACVRARGRTKRVSGSGCVHTGRRCVCGCINQILTVSERDRGHRPAAFQRLSLYLLWQFPRCSRPPGHCVCRCLSVSPENTSQVDQSPPKNDSFWTGQGRAVSPFRSPQLPLLTNHSASLQLTGTTKRFSRGKCFSGCKTV